MEGGPFRCASAGGGGAGKLAPVPSSLGGPTGLGKSTFVSLRSTVLAELTCAVLRGPHISWEAMGVWSTPCKTSKLAELAWGLAAWGLAELASWLSSPQV